MSSNPSNENVLPSDFVWPNRPSACTWKRERENRPENPHHMRHFNPDHRPKIHSNILETIGMTPMVKINNIPKSYGIKCEMFAKCEFMNPGGSIKDRMSLRMIEEAERKGLLKQGSTVIEPSSGNTGIGLAMVCALRGYNCVIVMPEKNSNEKLNTLKMLGAKVIRTPSVPFSSPESWISVAQRLQKEIPDSIILDQYRNPGNPLAHFDWTGFELLHQMDWRVDMIVVGAGTGGTITGVGRKVKEDIPWCQVVGVDPESSVMARPETLNGTSVKKWEVEGIGHSFIPTVLDYSVIDKWIKVNDSESFTMARRLIKEEGFLVGGSSGAVMCGALKAAKDLHEGQRCVVVLPDGTRKFMSTFVDDNWMANKQLEDLGNPEGHWWWNKKVSELKFPPPLTVSPDMTCQSILEKLQSENIDRIALLSSDNTLLGIASVTSIMNKLANSELNSSDSIKNAVSHSFPRIDENASLGSLASILEKDFYAVVIAEHNEFIDGGRIVRDVCKGIVTYKIFNEFVEIAKRPEQT